MAKRGVTRRVSDFDDEKRLRRNFDGFPASGHAAPGGGDAFHAFEHGVTGELGFGGEPGARLDVPVAQDDRHQDLLVVDVEVVDPGARDGLGVVREVDDPGSGHLERADLVLDRIERIANAGRRTAARRETAAA